jgi:drug/metabolite transporter (DMT)-like permease
MPGSSEGGPSDVAVAIGVLCLLATLVTVVFNVRYALRRRGKVLYRRLKLLNAAVSVLACAAYWLYLLGLTSMPGGGALIATAMLALFLIVAAGSIANDS